MGSNSKLSKEEICQRLSVAYEQLPVIKNFDTLLTLATQMGNLHAIEWFGNDTFHASYPITLSNISNAIELIITSADDGGESKDPQLHMTRSIMNYWLTLRKNKEAYKIFNSKLPKAVQYKNYHYVYEVVGRGDLDDFFKCLKACLKNSKETVTILNHIILYPNLGVNNNNQKWVFETHFKEAFIIALEHNYFDLALAVSAAAASNYYRCNLILDKEIIALLQKFRKKEISSDIFVKIFNNCKIIINRQGYGRLTSRADILGSAIELANHEVLNYCLSSLGFEAKKQSNIAIEKYNNRLADADTVKHVITQLLTNRHATKEEVCFVIQIKDLMYLKQLIASNSAGKYLNQDSLYLAASVGSLEIVDFLTRLPIPNLITLSQPALNIAAKNGYIDIVKLLISKGVTCTETTLKSAEKPQNHDSKELNYIRIQSYISCVLAIRKNNFSAAATACIQLDEEDKKDLVRLFENNKSMMIQLVGENIYKKAFQTPMEDKPFEFKTIASSAPDLRLMENDFKKTFQTPMEDKPLELKATAASAPDLSLMEQKPFNITFHNASFVLDSTRFSVEEKQAEVKAASITPSAPDLFPTQQKPLEIIFHDELSDSESFFTDSLTKSPAVSSNNSIVPIEVKKNPSPAIPNSIFISTTAIETKPTTLETLLAILKIKTEISEFLLTPEPSQEGKPSTEFLQIEGESEPEPGATELQIKSLSRFSFFPHEQFDIENDQKAAHQLLDLCKRGAGFWMGNEQLQKQLQHFCFQKLYSLGAKHEIQRFRA